MDDFITKFKQTSYYKNLFEEAGSDILLMYVGGSRGRKLENEFSDYDIIIITLDGKYVDLFKQTYVTYNDKHVHWYYCPVKWFFNSKCNSLYDYTGILTLKDVSDDIILYKNPKYEGLIDELFKLKTELIHSACYSIFDFGKEYMTDAISNSYIPSESSTKDLYFLCLASYYLFDEPFDVDFLKALSLIKHGIPISDDYKKKALERLTLIKNHIEQNPLDTQSTMKKLYDYISPKILNPNAEVGIYFSKYNFGTDYRVWNPWFGCFKLTEACANCYVKPENTFKNKYYSFLHSDAKPGTFISVCLNSDFFLKEADEYRQFAWSTIRDNPNLIFLIITKRVDRISECLPDDWGEGYDNVIICATVENQRRADERLPILLNLPIKHRWITCSPLLEPIQLSNYLDSGKIEHVEATGERECGNLARPTQYEWVDDICKQCIESDVRFSMLYLGHNFIMPDSTVKRDWSKWYRSRAADSLNIHYYKPITFKLHDYEITY